MFVVNRVGHPWRSPSSCDLASCLAHQIILTLEPLQSSAVNCDLIDPRLCAEVKGIDNTGNEETDAENDDEGKQEDEDDGVGDDTR